MAETPTLLKTIAIADDEPSIRLAVKSLIARSGYTLAGECENGLQAVELVRTGKPQLILLDMHMPGQNGLQATEQISKLGTTAVVLLTADVALDIPHKAMDLGATGYLQKPFESAQLISMMESAWHRFNSIQQLKGEIRELNESLETRKLVEKAKGILMEQQNFTEEAAHQALQKMSQEQGLSLKEVCRSVIQVKMILGKQNQKRVA